MRPTRSTTTSSACSGTLRRRWRHTSFTCASRAPAGASLGLGCSRPTRASWRMVRSSAGTRPRCASSAVARASPRASSPGSGCRPRGATCRLAAVAMGCSSATAFAGRTWRWRSPRTPIARLACAVIRGPGCARPGGTSASPTTASSLAVAPSARSARRACCRRTIPTVLSAAAPSGLSSTSASSCTTLGPRPCARALRWWNARRA
mmetsp:Transcript_58193/g.161018  ORF Transcript_58193/g.161018 Transcript_58193/m.161018 type:complete len:206 (-) Transcript_58193:150-767(-)